MVLKQVSLEAAELNRRASCVSLASVPNGQLGTLGGNKHLQSTGVFFSLKFSHWQLGGSGFH